MEEYLRDDSLMDIVAEIEDLYLDETEFYLGGDDEDYNS